MIQSCSTEKHIFSTASRCASIKLAEKKRARLSSAQAQLSSTKKLNSTAFHRSKTCFDLSRLKKIVISGVRPKPKNKYSGPAQTKQDMCRPCWTEKKMCATLINLSKIFFDHAQTKKNCSTVLDFA